MDPPIAQVPLILESTIASSAPQPVTIGVPWPRGVLTDDLVLSLSDPSGNHVRLQATPLARWPDRSVKWLLLDLIVGPVGEVRGDWLLELHPSGSLERLRPEGALRLKESEGGVLIETGSASFTLDREVLAPIVQAEIDGVPLLDATRSQAVLTDARGRGRRPRIERYEVEDCGAVRATLRFEGDFGGRRRDRCRFIARLSFFAGSPLVRIDLTVHNPRRARHPGGLWDLGDRGSILFRDLSLQLGLGGSGPRRVRWDEGVDGAEETTEADTFEIYQDSSGGENWQSRNHVNRYGQVPCQFRGYRVCRGGETSSGLRASPVISMQSPTATITAAIPGFWQQFPKAIDARGQTLNLSLFPDQSGNLFELQGGEQKTHTVWLHFGRAPLPGVESLRWVHRPACLRSTPEWYAGTKAVPFLSPASADPGDHFESYVSPVVDGPISLFDRREIIDEYGWRNFGDVHADHEETYHDGPKPVISHYNNQYDMVLGMILQYLRTGNPRWSELFRPLVRHVTDIDIYHTTQDKAAYNGGLFWFTDHYKDALTSTHRTYSRGNCRPGDSSYGGGPSSNHNFTTGLLYAYYLEGQPEVRDAVIGLANWVIRMDDGRNTLLGLIDPGPTGLASVTGTPDYHGPGRGSGNSVNAVLDAWQITGFRKYLDFAEMLIRRSIHPADDIESLGLLDVEKRWSYTVFLSELARYLILKAESNQLDSMYAYARASLLAYARWMLAHEGPYFDQPEKLEYPTEAWAGQELRKANVLRLAAGHADDELRSELLRRAEELAVRAWSDLQGFETRATARALAILMVEGTLDVYYRRQPVHPEPRADRPEESHFGTPEPFVPQKTRVLARLKTASGLVRAMAGLADPRRWGPLLVHRDR